MTVEELKNITPEELVRLSKRENYKELSRSVGQMASAANKRYNSLKLYEKRTGYKASYLLEHKDMKKFGVGRGANKNTLMAELTRIRNFLTASTSTVTGEKAYRSKLVEMLGAEMVDTYDPDNHENWTNFWDTWNRAKQVYANYIYTMYKLIGNAATVNSFKELYDEHNLTPESFLTSDGKRNPEMDKIFRDWYETQMLKEVEFSEPIRGGENS